MSGQRRQSAYAFALIMIGAPLVGAFGTGSGAPAPLATYTLDPIPGLEYVAVAPLSWADHLEPLIDWKTSKGVPAQVFPLEYIYSSFSGRDAAEKLHNFLADLHFIRAPTTKWLLLVGDGDWDNQTVPDREVFTDSQQDGNLNNSGNWYTTDTYYGNLESSWDEDGDGIFGELNEGDWTPDLYVGRVPVDNVASLDRWVARQVMYERSPPQGVWARRAILAGAVMDRPNVVDDIFTAQDEGYDAFSDNPREANDLIASYLPPSMDVERYEDYPEVEGGAYSASTDTLDNGTLRGALSAGASFMFLAGHGYTSNRGVAQYADPDGTSSVFGDDGEEPALTFDEVLNLTNGDRLPLVYVSACYAGDFTDRDDTSFEAFLEAPNGGAIAVVAGNGENYRLENVSGQQAFGNWHLAEQFFHMLFQEGYAQPGKVLGDLKQRYNAYFMADGPTDTVNQNYFRAERVSYNLMGDPEFSLITSPPATMTASPLRQPLVGEPSVRVQVQGTGGAVAGALVRISGPAGDVHAVTNATGVATVPYVVLDTQAFNITVTAQNHYPLTTAAAGAVPDHNLAFEPGALTAPAVVRRNEVITVSGVVVADGVAAFSNVVVEFRLGNPTTGESVGALSLPTVAPGTPRAVSAALTLPQPGDYLVYATIDPGEDLTEDTRGDNVAFARVRVNAPPVFGEAPPLRLKEGGVLPDAVFLPAFVTDEESGSHTLAYAVTSVSDDRLVVVLQNRTLGFRALEGASPVVTVEVEADDGLDRASGTFTVAVDRANTAPVIGQVAGLTAHVGELFSYNLSATDAEGDVVLWSDTSALFDITPSGQIRFTPTSAQAGSHAITITASDTRLARSTTVLITVDERQRFIEVRNPPAVRAWPGQEVVIDLYALSPDPDVRFIPQSGNVFIDNETRTLHYTPSRVGVDTLTIVANKTGLPNAQVAITVDVAAPPAGGAEIAAFALAGVLAAGLVGLTLVRAHQARLRDERAFMLEGKPDKARRSRGGEEE